MLDPVDVVHGFGLDAAGIRRVLTMVSLFAMLVLSATLFLLSLFLFLSCFFGFRSRFLHHCLFLFFLFILSLLFLILVFLYLLDLFLFNSLLDLLAVLNIFFDLWILITLVVLGADVFLELVLNLLPDLPLSDVRL